MIKILDNFFPKEVNKYIETFTGGGSVLLHIMQKYQPEVAYANDIDSMLINYYKCVKNEPDKVINECLDIKNSYNHETFTDKFYELDRSIASHFFTANKTSFSGLNKNYSYQAYDRNFSVRCINKIKDISNVVTKGPFLILLLISFPPYLLFLCFTMNFSVRAFLLRVL